MLSTFCFKAKLMNFSHVTNEVLSFLVHLNILFQGFKLNGNFDAQIKKACFYIFMALWIANSLFSVLGFVIKIIEFFKEKAKKRKVETERKKNDELVITNLNT